MSGKNGNGRIGKYHRRVSKEAGLQDGEQLPYAPDFLDSLVRRMATPGDFTERTFAWLVYRASGNQSLTAIHLYGKKSELDTETELRQRDCCLELAWLEAGHPAEWLDAPLHLFREEAARRGVEPIERSNISDGFAENRERGTVASGTGHRLVLIPSPFVADSSAFQETKGEDPPPYRTFKAEWDVAHSAEIAEEQVARSTLKRINKIRLSDYKKWKRSATPQQNGGTSLEALETVEPLEATPAVAPVQPVVHHHQTSLEEKNPTTLPPKKVDDDGKPKPLPEGREYLNARAELIAIFKAKAHEAPKLPFLNVLEGILVNKGHTFEELLEELRPHLANEWRNPPGFLIDFARKAFLPPVEEPALKPKPKCPRCRADNQRGAILEDGKIVPCPDCSTDPAWREELAAKEAARQHNRTKGAGG